MSVQYTCPCSIDLLNRQINTTRTCIFANVVVGLVVVLGYTNITDWFNAANLSEFFTAYADIIVRKKNNIQIEINFKSGKNTWLDLVSLYSHSLCVTTGIAAYYV